MFRTTMAMTTMMNTMMHVPTQDRWNHSNRHDPTNTNDSSSATHSIKIVQDHICTLILSTPITPSRSNSSSGYIGRIATCPPESLYDRMQQKGVGIMMRQAREAVDLCQSCRKWHRFPRRPKKKLKASGDAMERLSLDIGMLSFRGVTCHFLVANCHATNCIFTSENVYLALDRQRN